MRLDSKIFQCVINNTPLVSVDLIAEYDGKILLGKRRNKPAKDYYFTTGGRVYKNERIDAALERIAKEELGCKLQERPEFIGVFEHFYNDAIFEKTSTHYVNLAYRYKLDFIEYLPTEQHDAYKLFNIDELLQSDSVHAYVKDYFTKEGNKWHNKK